MTGPRQQLPPTGRRSRPPAASRRRAPARPSAKRLRRRRREDRCRPPWRDQKPPWRCWIARCASASSASATAVRGCPAQPIEIDLAAPGMQVQQPLPQLGHLRHAPGDRHARDRMTAQVLQHAANEIAHVDQRLRPAADKAGQSRPRRSRRSPRPHGPDPPRAPHRCRDRSSGSRRSRNKARRSRWCPGSTAPRRCPRRPFSVRSAIFSPPGIDSSTTASPLPPQSAATSAIAVRIISRGTGLIAGSPGGSGRPGRVTVPTPSPARKMTPLPGAPRRTVARTSAPCVTSGSSPASLTMPARANVPTEFADCQSEAGPRPARQQHRDGIGKRAGQQRLIRGSACGGGAGSRRPAAPQRALECGTLHGASSYRTRCDSA